MSGQTFTLLVFVLQCRSVSDPVNTKQDICGNCPDLKDQSSWPDTGPWTVDKTGDSGDYIKMEYETGTEIPRLPTNLK